MTVISKFLSYSLLLVWLGVPSISISAENEKVQLASNFESLGLTSSRKSIPILLIFSSDHCAYCEILEKEVIIPIMLSHEYDNKVIIRKLVMDIPETVKDFDGKPVSSDVLVSRYNIKVTPTVVFLDNHGKQLTRRLVGINVIDYFTHDVEQSIKKSVEILQSRARKLSASSGNP